MNNNIKNLFDDLLQKFCQNKQKFYFIVEIITITGFVTSLHLTSGKDILNEFITKEIISHSRKFIIFTVLFSYITYFEQDKENNILFTLHKVLNLPLISKSITFVWNIIINFMLGALFYTIYAQFWLGHTIPSHYCLDLIFLLIIKILSIIYKYTKETEKNFIFYRSLFFILPFLGAFIYDKLR